MTGQNAASWLLIARQRSGVHGSRLFVRLAALGGEQPAAQPRRTADTGRDAITFIDCGV